VRKMGKFPGRWVDLSRRKPANGRPERRARQLRFFGRLSLAVLFAVAA
jgi:hypothetical protein